MSPNPILDGEQSIPEHGKNSDASGSIVEQSFLPPLSKVGMSPKSRTLLIRVAEPLTPERKTLSDFDDFLNKVVAASLSLALVLGGAFVSGSSHAGAVLGKSEDVGVRVSSAISGTLGRFTDAVMIVGNAYLATLQNSGVYAVAGIGASVGASRDMMGLYASALEGAGSTLAQPVPQGYFGSASLAAVSTASDPSPVTTGPSSVGGGLGFLSSGITILDRANGSPVCVYVENEAVKISMGACVPASFEAVPNASGD